MLSGCRVHCQQPVKMLRLKSGTPSLRERERVCVYVCMCVAVCERKPLSGSCVVWMLRPLSAARPVKMVCLKSGVSYVYM